VNALNALRVRLNEHNRARAEFSASDEAGAVLVLALIFLVAVSLIVTALLTLVGTSLSATSSFNNQRNLEYAMTSTVNLAIQQTRTTFNSSLLEASPPVPCWGPTTGTSDLTINGYTINVWCSMTWSPFSGSTRVITYSACPQYVQGKTNPSDATNFGWKCGKSPLLQAIESYDDYATNSPVTAQPVNCNAINSCGQTQTQISWLWNPVVPEVASVTSTSGSAATGASNATTQFTINGSGFVQGAQVNLVWETGPNPESWTYPSNTANAPETDVNGVGTIVQATVDQSTLTSTQISATAPAVSTGPYFFVTVTTPSGTSAYFNYGTQTYNVFTYSPVSPTISTVSGLPTVSGGALITVTGSGFYNASNFATQVLFTQSSGASAQGTSVTVNPTGTSASPGALLTAISPAVSSGGTWYVQVHTVGGTSAQLPITFGVQQPIITSMSPPSSAANPALLTITGANFLSGSSVWFCLTTAPAATLTKCQAGTSGGGEIAAVATVATSGTSIMASLPTTGMAVNSTYYAVVQLPAPYNTSAWPPSQTYNESSDIFTFT
jgi:hypothetical protein